MFLILRWLRRSSNALYRQLALVTNSLLKLYLNVGQNAQRCINKHFVFQLSQTKGTAEQEWGQFTPSGAEKQVSA